MRVAFNLSNGGIGSVSVRKDCPPETLLAMQQMMELAQKDILDGKFDEPVNDKDQ